MSGAPERLRRARLDAGYASAAAAARAMAGVNRFTYSQHENGTRNIPRDAAVKYAKFFKVSLDWLLNGRQHAGLRPQVEVVNYVTSGGEIEPVMDRPDGLEMVEPPMGVEADCVAAKVRGDSAYPIGDGWLIFWEKTESGVSDKCIGRVCVCKTKSGRTVLRVLHKGSRRGFYTLTAWAAPAAPMQNVRLAWATPVLGLRQS